MNHKDFRKLRERSGLTRKEAAHESGYCYSSWTHYETGFKKIPQKIVFWLQEYVHVQELKERLERLQQRQQRQGGRYEEHPRP